MNKEVLFFKKRLFYSLQRHLKCTLRFVNVGLCVLAVSKVFASCVARQLAAGAFLTALSGVGKRESLGNSTLYLKITAFNT